MILAMLAVAAGCANPDTTDGQRKIASGIPACESRAKHVPSRARPVRPAERARALAAFDKLLKDGASARWQFDEVRGEIICGHVNAKNSFGAYTGWSSFTVGTDGTGATIYDAKRAWLFDLVCGGAKQKGALR